MRLLAAGADASLRNYNREHPLAIAAMKQHDMVKLLESGSGGKRLFGLF